jgi:hypothetical protein
LKGDHGADLSTVKDIEQEGFNDIVFVVAEGNLVTFETMGKMEKTFSPFPGAEEARVFSILRAVRPSSDIGEFDMVTEPFGLKKLLQGFCSPRIKAEVNIGREKVVMDWNSFTPFVEEVEERQAILPSGDSNKNPIAILNQAITVDCLSHQTPNLFFPIGHNLKTRKGQRA